MQHSSMTVARSFDHQGSRSVTMLAIAMGVVAVGGLAIGAFAIGRLAIGRVAVRIAKFKSLEIEDLTVTGSLKLPSITS